LFETVDVAQKFETDWILTQNKIGLNMALGGMGPKQKLAAVNNGKICSMGDKKLFRI
jgi:hypothetical protein